LRIKYEYVSVSLTTINRVHSKVMKRFKIHFVVLIVLLAGVAVGLSSMTTSRGQSQATSKSETVGIKRTASIRPAPATYGPAATSNATLVNDLNWVFGRKPQRGWYLYVPLITRLIDTEHDVHTDDFAQAVERWQKKSGVVSTGVLDDVTLYAMVSEWQGRRLKDRSPAAAEQLITAPPSDFFDPERVDELRQVERETYAAYKRMVAAAVADNSLNLGRDAKGELAATEKFFKIISSFRTREYQDKLRRESPHAGSAGLAINSPHFTGRALDIYVGGEPVETNDRNRLIQVQTPVYKWLVRNAERFGFRPYYYEPWHWEYVGR
jgi:D-alanyl-D-alanine carboxypeptidase